MCGRIACTSRPKAACHQTRHIQALPKMKTKPDIAALPLLPDPRRHLGAIRRLLELILLALMIIGLYFAKEVVLPLLMGGILALTLSPVVRALQRKGIAPPASAVALIFGLALAIGGSVFAFSGPVSEWVSQAPRLEARLKAKFVALTSSVDAVRSATEKVDKLTNQTNDLSVQRVAIQSPGILTSAVTGAASLLSAVAVTLVLALFLLASGDMFYVKLMDAFPKFGDKKRALRIVYGIEHSISRYLLSVTMINAGLGVVVFFAMWITGMPQPMVWGAVAFLFNFVPYVGAAVGVGLSAAVAIVTFPSLPHALLVPSLFLGATLVEGQFLTPILLGRRMELNTVAVFVTLVFWGWLWGIAGALMAMPFLVCLKVVCDNFEPLRTLGIFLSSAADPAPPAATR